MGVSSIGLSGFDITMTLCEKLPKIKKTIRTDYYGTVIDHLSPKPRRFTLHPPSTVEESHGNDGYRRALSLEEVLRRRGDPSSFLPLPAPCTPGRHHCVKLAAAIQTPWLASTLKTHDICFLSRDGLPAYDHIYILNNPPEVAKVNRTGPKMPFRLNPASAGAGGSLS